MRLEPVEGPNAEFHISRWDLPALVALSWVLSKLGALSFFALIPLHELGHALAAWVFGVPAVPTLVFTFTASGRSALFAFVVFALAALGACYCALKNARILAGALGAFALTALSCSFGAQPAFARQAIIAGGIVGEAAFGALAVLFFHVGVPRVIRWDFLRYPVTLWTCTSLWTSLGYWKDVRRGLLEVPLGSALGGSESDGDLARLIADHGWTETTILAATGKFHGAVLACVALVVLMVALRAMRKPSSDFRRFSSRR